MSLRRKMLRAEEKRAREAVGALPIEHDDQGDPLLIVRPKDPRLALAMADVAAAKQDSDLFQRIPTEQDYTFVGWMGRKGGKIVPVDEHGVPNGEDVKAGDSFVSGEFLDAEPS